ncbi:glycosyltransferase family 2 protein [Reichenbachiella ulvae]|uniref:Glycosyltransferase family 2 protein n=1 Tax=Reichenbachiella ulvae TaxID=2980104 RepID=A0ABT3D0N3_9BACT|nr:glycosyltransferase family 2 protein [Reichenbachiella ulvae]MCV9389467.1 glycosyltransferase family 2 protein [Reichenbachiella ulvae]
MEILFWAMIGLVVYTYVGYGIVLYMLVKIKGSSIKEEIFTQTYEVPITHIIAAYNEEDYIEEKIENAINLNYPSELNQVWVVTDGSSDSTPERVKKFPNVRLFHSPERKGKIHAVNRVMPEVTTPIVVYSDANTVLNSMALHNITRHYLDPKVGCVSGEKRVRQEDSDQASSAGEGMYWKYESFLKKLDYQLYSVVGAAGELFSIRTDLYETIHTDTLIEDFYLSLSIAQKGYKIAYEPDAYALENSSDSIKEESKRKIRIAAGGHQAIWRLRSLMNIFKYGWLSWQYVSHRVLRWTLTPLALLGVLILNFYLALDSGFYRVVLVLQMGFYFLAFLGFVLQTQKIKVKALFVPFYFTFMNVSVFQGFARIIRGRQSVLWERAARKK